MTISDNKPGPKKSKLVRDSFTIPKEEFAAIDSLKTRAVALGTSVKKSELLRAGLLLLQGLDEGAFKAALAGVPTLKTGRPSKTGEAKTAARKPVVKAALKPAVQAKTDQTSPAPAAAPPAAASPAAKPAAARKAANRREPATPGDKPV